MPPNPGIRPKSQFGKAETRHLVGDDEIANQGQLEPAAEGYSVDSGDGGQRRSIDRVHDFVDAFQKFPHAARRRLLIHSLRAVVELAQIGAGAES